MFILDSVENYTRNAFICHTELLRDNINGGSASGSTLRSSPSSIDFDR